MSEREELELKLKWYKKLKAKLEKILNAELDIDDYDTEIYVKIESIEEELFNLED